MATFVGIGYSQNPDPIIAAQEAAAQAQRQFLQGKIDLAIVFSSVHYDPKIFLPTLHEALQQTRVIGSSTAALFLPNKVCSRGLAVMVISSNTIVFETSAISHIQLREKKQAGEELANATFTDFNQGQRKLFFCLADGLLDGLADLAEGITSRFTADIPLALASNSDNFLFQKTYQFHNNQEIPNGAVSLLLGGRFDLGVSYQHGFTPVGMPRPLDSVKGKVINTINGKNAFSFYEEYFGPDAQTLKSETLGPLNYRYPLGFRSFSQKEYLLRNITGVLDDDSLVCQDKIPPNAEVSMMLSSVQSNLQATEKAATQVRIQLKEKKPAFIILIESLARYRLLGRVINEELSIIQSILGKDTPILGMCSTTEYLDNGKKSARGEIFLQNSGLLLIGIV